MLNQIDIATATAITSENTMTEASINGNPSLKFESAYDIASSKKRSLEYIAERREDADKLCLDMFVGDLTYCNVKKFTCDGQNPIFVLFKGAPSPYDKCLIMSDERACILAYILAKWW